MISPLLLFLLLQGRFTIAAKHHISIAEIYESEMVDIEKVILHNQRLHSLNTTNNYENYHYRAYLFRGTLNNICVFSFVKAIAHYEQAADYYKGEESNRYCSPCFFY